VDELTKHIDDLSTLQLKMARFSLSNEDHQNIKASILSFQKNFLKGFLLATRELREQPDLKTIHFALAIPDDRFAELEMREGANFGLSYVEQIRWNAFELVEFFVRRSQW
jgi:hypothetical protein